MKKNDLSGMRFERWTVVCPSDTKPRYYDCVCDCGKRKEVFSGNLVNGKSKSCGCLSAELTREREKTHGLTGTKEHLIWLSMVNRAHYYTTSNSFYYEERGIGVCQRWLDSFEDFLEDMGACPEGLTLERIDNKLGYSPDNCKWDSPSRQASNRRKNKSNTSGRIGVYWREDQKKWRVSIKVDKVQYNIGSFSDFKEACEACTEAEIMLLGYSREDS